MTGRTTLHLSNAVWFALALTGLAAAQPIFRNEPAQDLFDEGERLYGAGLREAAVKPFLAAAQAGNSMAQLQIGWHYEKGVGVTRSYSEAAKWYRKSVNQGNPIAMKNLGQFYESVGLPEFSSPGSFQGCASQSLRRGCTFG